MPDNRLVQLHAAGQSVWLDYIDRELLTDGSLARLIRDDALTGMTSNPTIFEKALAERHEYDDQHRRVAPPSVTARELFELVETTTCATACDVFAACTKQRNGRTATSRSRCLPVWRTTPTRPSTKRSGSGRRSIART